MIRLEIKPKPKPRMVKSDAWKGRKVVKDYWQYKKDLRKVLDESKIDLDYIFDNGEMSRIIFFIQMPKSWSKKKKEEMNLQPHKQRPDLDNLIKAFKDCLLDEDSEVYRYKSVKKIWAYRGFIGIFPDRL